MCVSTMATKIIATSPLCMYRMITANLLDIDECGTTAT